MLPGGSQKLPTVPVAPFVDVPSVWEDRISALEDAIVSPPLYGGGSLSFGVLTLPMSCEEVGASPKNPFVGLHVWEALLTLLGGFSLPLGD